MWNIHIGWFNKICDRAVHWKLKYDWEKLKNTKIMDMCTSFINSKTLYEGENLSKSIYRQYNHNKNFRWLFWSKWQVV